MFRSYVKFISYLIATAVFSGIGFTLAIGMLNEPSSISVVTGIAILVALLVALVPIGLFGYLLGRDLLGHIRKMHAEVMKKKVGEPAQKSSKSSVATLLVLASALGASSGCTRIDAGQAGIVVHLAGDQRGVDDLPVQTGWVFYNPIGTSVFEYPTFMQTVQWTKDVHEGNPANEEITFTTKEGLVVSADVSLSYQLQWDKIPAFYVKFRTDDLGRFTHGFLRNVTRDQFNEVASHYPIESIVGDNEKFVAEVRARLAQAVSGIGCEVQQFGFIGAPRPPANVIAAINAKIGATQLAMQAENEVRRVRAEAEKRVAEAEGAARAAIAQAEGEAKARRITADSEAYTNVTVSRSITPALVEYLRAKKWDGRVPQVTGAGSTFVNLK